MSLPDFLNIDGYGGNLSQPMDLSGILQGAGQQDFTGGQPMPSLSDIVTAAAAPGGPLHKGMFGVHGGLRDILGLVGDTMLQANGDNPLYAGIRQNEHAQDAFSTFAQDPMGSLAKLYGVNPAIGAKTYDTWSDQQAKHETAVQAAAKERFAQANIVKQQIASMLNSAHDDATYQAAKRQAQAMAAPYGIDLSLYPDSYDALAVGDAARGSMEMKDQLQSDYRNASLEERRGYHQGQLAQGYFRTTTGSNDKEKDRQDRQYRTGYQEYMRNYRHNNPTSRGSRTRPVYNGGPSNTPSGNPLTPPSKAPSGAPPAGTPMTSRDGKRHGVMLPNGNVRWDN